MRIKGDFSGFSLYKEAKLATEYKVIQNCEFKTLKKQFCFKFWKVHGIKICPLSTLGKGGGK